MAKVKYDPMTGERMVGLAKVPDMLTCVGCGITSLDGAPEHDVPYPSIEPRAEHGGGLLCGECAGADCAQKKDGA